MSTSRRALLGAATALAGASAANLAAIASRRAASPADAELIELGHQFDVLVARHHALDEQRKRLEEDPELVRAEAAVDAVIQRNDGRDTWISFNPNDWAEDQAALYHRLAGHRDECRVRRGIEDILNAMSDVTDAMYPLQRAIVAAKATTVAGAAVKARSAAFQCSHYGSESGDWDQELAHDAIKAVLAVAAAGVVS